MRIPRLPVLAVTAVLLAGSSSGVAVASGSDDAPAATSSASDDNPAVHELNDTVAAEALHEAAEEANHEAAHEAGEAANHELNHELNHVATPRKVTAQTRLRHRSHGLVRHVARTPHHS